MLPRNLIALIAVLMLVLAACGEDEAGSVGADPTATVDSTPTVAPHPTTVPEPTPTEVQATHPAAEGGYELVAYWGERATLTTPNDIAFAGDGTMFVSDHGLREIFVFDAGVDLESSWQPVGVGPDGSERVIVPANIAADSSGTLYVTGSMFTFGITAFDREGNRLTTLSTGEEDEHRHRWMGIEVGDDDRLYALSGSNRDSSTSPAPDYGIYIFNDEGNLEDFLTHPDGRIPHAITHDNAGSLYVVSHEPPGSGVQQGNDTISRVSISQYGEAEWVDTDLAVEQIAHIDGLFVDPDGQLFVINQAGPGIPGPEITVVTAIGPQGDVLDEWELEGQGKVEPAFAPGIASGRDGLTYFADPRNYQILVLDRSWAVTDRISPETDGLTGQLAGMTVGADGNLYVADARLNQVLVLDPDGVAIHTMPLPGYLSDVISPGMALDVDGSGNVYVAQHARPQTPMVKLSPDGEILQEWSARSFFDLEQGLTARFSPSNVVALGNGDFYITVAQSPWVLLFKDGNDEPVAFWPESRNAGVSLNIAMYGDRLLVAAIVEDEETGETVVALKELAADLESETGTIVQFPVQTVDQESDIGFVRKFALDSEGNIYAADPIGQQVIKVGPDGEEITRWPVEPLGSVLSPPEMYIAVDDAGRVFVTGPDTRQVAVYAPVE